jgi:hypothetical protein
LIAVVIFVLPDMSAAKPMSPGIDPDPDAVGGPKSSYFLSQMPSATVRALSSIKAGPPGLDLRGWTAGAGPPERFVAISRGVVSAGNQVGSVAKGWPAIPVAD